MPHDREGDRKASQDRLRALNPSLLNYDLTNDSRQTRYDHNEQQFGSPNTEQLQDDLQIDRRHY